MKTNISRRDFLRKAGISALAAGGLGTVYGCSEDRTEKKPSSGHGFGQKILTDIASLYHGEFFTEYVDGIYKAAISLQLSSASEQ